VIRAGQAGWQGAEAVTHRSMTTDSWTFCHKCARMIWISEIFSVGICARHVNCGQ